MAKLNYIGRTDHLVNFSCNSSVEELQDWFNKQKIVQFDTETNVTDSIVSRHLKVLQFGSLDGSEVFVIQWSFLTDDQKELVLKLLTKNEVLKIIHNASFDYQMILKSGVVMENVWDTMVMEQCLYAGHDFDLRFFSLAAVLLRRYYIDVSKENQGEFGDDIINDEKLVYAATDVVHLGRLYEDQRRELINEDLIQLGEGEYTENEALLAFADMEYYGMGFDPVKWRDNIALAEPIVEDATNKLTAILTQEPYLSLGKELNINAKLISPSGRERTVEMPAILPEDFVTVNWNSSPQALEVLQLIPIFKDLEKASVLELKKFLQERDPKAPKVNDKGKPIGVTSKAFTEYVNDMSPDWFVFIKLLINKDYNHLEEAFKMNFRDKLIEHKYLIPKGSVMINWNSNLAKLAVFRWFNSEVENTDADTVDNNIDMPFFQAYKQYNNANSLLTKYGEKFIEKHVDIDGRVRTRYNTVLSTGRVSSSQPKLHWAA